MADEPLRTTTFTLTRADALAFEQASSRMNPLGVMALLLWLGLCGSLAWLIPPDWAGERLGWTFPVLVSIIVTTGYVLVLMVYSFRQWLLAGRRLKHARELTLTEWPDRLEIIGAGMPRDLPFRDIRESILIRTHLFLVSDNGVLILPRHAFAEENVIEGLAARIAGRPGPVPVDAAATGA